MHTTDDNCEPNGITDGRVTWNKYTSTYLRNWLMEDMLDRVKTQ